MKKILLMFVFLDILFVGIVLTIAKDPINLKMVRGTASDASKELTEGQKQKVDLIKSLTFSVNNDETALSTNYFSQICELDNEIKLVYSTSNVAYAGENPSLEHLFKCVELNEKKMTELRTPLIDFENVRLKNPIAGTVGEIKGKGLFKDEPLPRKWNLSSIQVTGKSNFTISQSELAEVGSTQNFDFEMLTFPK